MARAEMRPDWCVLITVETGCWVPEGSLLNLMLYTFDPFIIKALCM